MNARPSRASALAAPLRLSLRAVAAAASTAAYLTAYELETKLRHLPALSLAPQWVPRWARSLLSIFGVVLRTEGDFIGRGLPYPGRADDTGRVFVMNHRSAIDVLVVFAMTEGHLVSRHDLARWPGVGMGARRIGTMFVDRSSMRSGATVLKEMTRALAAGRGVAIFPEGTAFAGDEIRPFRPGAFKAAIRSGAEIVPMGIAYADEAAYYGDESFGGHAKRVATLPHIEAALAVGKPIASEGKKLVDLRDEARTAVADQVRRARALLERTEASR